MCSKSPVTANRSRVVFCACALATLAIAAGSPASADFECSTTAEKTTCINSGTHPGFFTNSEVAKSVKTKNSGTVDGFLQSFTTDGNATTKNSGTVNNFMQSFTTNGNARVKNSGNVVNFLQAFTTNGDARAKNSGEVGNFFQAFTTNGNARATNSGNVVNFAQAFTSTGDAWAKNSGNVGNFLQAFTSTGNAWAKNSGNVANFFQAFTTTGDAWATNSGNVANFFQAFTSTGDAWGENSGTVHSFMGVDTSDGNAWAKNTGTVGTAFQTASGIGNAWAKNSGTIGTFFLTSTHNGNAWAHNTGTVGTFFQVFAHTGNATAWNSGTVNDTVSAGTDGGGRAAIYNSGFINNFGGIAVEFFGSGPDKLVLFPGSLIVGAINLDPTHDTTIKFKGGNHNLTFNTLAGATAKGKIPFAVHGNQAAAVDPTLFSVTDALLMDFTRSLTSLVATVSPNIEYGGGRALPYAAATGAAWGEQIFGNIQGQSAYAADAAVFKAPPVGYADGTVIWARAFAGERIRDAEGVLLRNDNRYYGAALGGEKQVRPNLWLGAFIGGGSTKTKVDVTLDSADNDLGFAGVYGRTAWGASFLHASLHGGFTGSSTTRYVNNNLLPNGIEIARASYDGWYVSPEVTIGHHFALGHVWNAYHTVTPSLQVRYLYASFDGYTETGTTAPLSAGTRTVENVEERAELKFTRTTMLSPQTALMLNVFGGGLGVQRIGGTAIGASLLGQPIPFATPGEDTVWGGFGGGGFEVRHLNVAAFASAEYLALSDDSTVVSGKAGVRVGF